MGSDSILAPAIQAHLEHLRVERRLAPRTLALYTQALTHLQTLAAAAGTPLLTDDGRPSPRVLPAHIRRFVAQRHAQGLSPRSLALEMSAWRGLYRHWCRDGLLPANPVDGLRPPKAPRPLPKALPVDQAVALAATVPTGPDAALNARDHALVELLYGCGLRVGELVGLDLRAGPNAAGWVDLPDATAHVLGKGRKRRSVPVGGPALQALAAWLPHREQMARPDEPALFVSRRGTRLTDSQVRSRLKALGVQAGVSTPVHPHMLRHSYASHLLQSSGDLRAVQELLGHANIGTTQIYTRLDWAHLARAYDAAHPRARRKPGDEPPG